MLEVFSTFFQGICSYLSILPYLCLFFSFQSPAGLPSGHHPLLKLCHQLDFYCLDPPLIFTPSQDSTHECLTVESLPWSSRPGQGLLLWNLGTPSYICHRTTQSPSPLTRSSIAGTGSVHLSSQLSAGWGTGEHEYFKKGRKGLAAICIRTKVCGGGSG